MHNYEIGFYVLVTAKIIDSCTAIYIISL